MSQLSPRMLKNKFISLFTAFDLLPVEYVVAKGNTMTSSVIAREKQ